MKAKIQEESEQKLLENATIATEQEQILKNRICELEEKVTAELINNKILTVYVLKRT